MAVIRLYRKIYKINSSKASDLYSLINPFSITANTYLKDTSTIVETNTVVTKESDGVYFTDLNPIFYSYDNVYDLKWTVQYLENKPIKILTTSFKLNPINISGEITTEIENQEIQCEINDVQTIEVIIL
jgi:hypothetical protein